MNNKTQGYLYVLSAVTIFAFQDAFSKFLGAKYPPTVLPMVINARRKALPVARTLGQAREYVGQTRRANCLPKH